MKKSNINEKSCLVIANEFSKIVYLKLRFMAAMDNENKVAELKSWAQEAIELLDEVKPYRSIFYKQRVAKLKEELTQIIHQQTIFQLRKTVS